MASKHIFKKTAITIEKYREEMIELQKRLIAIPAIGPDNGGDGEMNKAKFLEPMLHETFDEIIECHTPDERVSAKLRPNYIATLKGKDTNKTIWFLAHMDVVPIGDESKWLTPPFEGVVKDGRIYGRGAEDNNQGLVTFFFAVKALKEEGITPPYNIGLLLVSDEETGSNYGLKYILEKCKNIFKDTDSFVVADGGNPTGQFIEVAEKGIARFKVTVIGKQCHSAYPNLGINSNRVMSYFATRVDALRKEYNKENSLFDLPFCTIEPTQRFANEASANTIPGKEIQMFDCRIIPDYNFAEFIEKFKTLAKEVAEEFRAEIEVEQVVSDNPSFTPPEKTPIIATLENAIKEVYGISASIHGESGGTAGRFLRYHGLRVVNWERLDNTLHGPNEYCVIDNMVGDAKVFAYVMLSD